MVVKFGDLDTQDYLAKNQTHSLLGYILKKSKANDTRGEISSGRGQRSSSF